MSDDKSFVSERGRCARPTGALFQAELLILFLLSTLTPPRAPPSPSNAMRAPLLFQLERSHPNKPVSSASMAGVNDSDSDVDLLEGLSDDALLSGASSSMDAEEASSLESMRMPCSGDRLEEPLMLSDTSSEKSDAMLDFPEEDESSEDLLGDVESHQANALDAATGKFLGRCCALGKQAQLLIANVASAMRGLSRSVLSSIGATLLTDSDRCSYSNKRLFWKICSKLLGVTVYRVQSCCRRMKTNGWQPASPRPWLFGEAGVETASGGASLGPSGVSLGAHPSGVSLGECGVIDPTLVNIVRVALASVVEGMSFQSYERQVQRMRLSGAAVGTKFCDRRFVTEVIALSSLVLQQLDAYDYNQPLPGLGIASDFAVLADPVSIGLTVHARHDVLLVMCLCLVSRHTGALYCPMFAGPPMPFGSHSGEAMASLMLQTLEEHPASWGSHALRSRCSSLCGDGGLCIGGPEHRHCSSDAVGKLWKRIHSDPVVVYPNGPAVSPPECCVWDPFHRADIAGWRAIKAVPLAVKVFDVSKQLDNLFAQSEGILLFRGAANILDESPHAIRAPGGTRKIVYLSGTPSSIVENYRVIIAALHGRVAWVQAGHRHQSLGYLHELGRSLSDPMFVTFVLLLSDILSMVVRPFAKQVQAACEPVVFHNSMRKLRSAIVESLIIVRRIRIMLRVVSLCRQHAPVDDLRLLVDACLSNCGPRFAAFAAHITGILLPPAPSEAVDQAVPMFKHTRLAVPLSDHNRSKEMCLGAHCQCPAHIAYHRDRWAKLCEGREDVVEDGLEPRTRIQLRARGSLKEVRVPVSVAYSPVQPRPTDAPLESIPARFTFLPRRAPTVPPSLNLAGLLRPRMKATDDGTVSRCQLPYTVYLVHDAVDEALAAGLDLLEKLNQEFDGILHSVGCNDDMSALLRHSALCWDWAVLITRPPTVEHVNAFQAVIRMLRPLLVQTLYPEGAGGGVSPFGGVSPCWPNDETLCMQYMALARRVRRAASGARNVPCEVVSVAKDWVRVTHFQARPLWVNRTVERLCSRRLSGLRKSSCLQIASSISSYAGILPPEAYVAQDFLPEQLTPCTQRRRRRRGKRKRSPSVSGRQVLRPGDIGVRHVRGKGMLMCIEGYKCSVNVPQVAAALDTLPWLSVGEEICTWHAARVHHRCRLLFPPDSPCERMGSYMRLAWDQRQGRASPVYVSDRLFLMQAGISCLGGDRDELIVRETCRLLQTTSKYRIGGDAPSSRSTTQALAPFVRSKDMALARSGRFSGTMSAEEAAMVLQPGGFETLQGQGVAARQDFLKHRARSAKPLTLPEVVHQGISKAVTNDGVVQPLPANTQVAHALQRGAASSVVREKLSSWLQSKEGLQWQAERKELFHGGEQKNTEEVPECAV